MYNWCKEVIDGESHRLLKPSDRTDFPDYPNWKNDNGTWKMNIELDPSFMQEHGYEDWTAEQEATWHEQFDPAPVVTVQDYDNALESHLLAERQARGYTTREPDYYINSSVPRWKQDAIDWVAHRDEVMLYGLSVENAYEAGEPVPTLDEFKAALPRIQWTLELSGPSPDEVQA